MDILVIRVSGAGGGLVGTALITKPPIGIEAMSTMHDERRPRPLRADAAWLDRPGGRRRSCSPTSRRPRRSRGACRPPATSRSGGAWSRAADRCVIDAGGLVGRHVGDGVVAFFLAETAGSESAAARACITAARALRAAVADVAARSDLEPDDVVLRFGLHWGSTLYVGQIATSGRSEVTALGDEVNEAARIEACATGGRALASKDLIERLEPDDAAALGLDPDRVTYTRARRPRAPRPRRPAATRPPIAVCEV